MPCVADGDPLQNCDGGVLTWGLPSGNPTYGWAVSFTLSADDNCAPLMGEVKNVPNQGPMTVLGNYRLAPGQTTPKYQIINPQAQGAPSRCTRGASKRAATPAH